MSGAYSISRIVAGPVSARQSHLSCPLQVEWSDQVSCVVTLLDAYSNPSDAFLFGTLRTGQDSVNYNALTFSKIEGGTGRAGYYNITYSVPRVRGMLNVTVYVEGNVVPEPGLINTPLLVGGKSASSQIMVTSMMNAGKVTCPPFVIAGKSLVCHVVIHDPHLRRTTAVSIQKTEL